MGYYCRGRGVNNTFMAISFPGEHAAFIIIVYSSRERDTLVTEEEKYE
jgi:hypothetical protein